MTVIRVLRGKFLAFLLKLKVPPNI